MGKTVVNHGCGVEIEEAKQMMKDFLRLDCAVVVTG